MTKVEAAAKVTGEKTKTSAAQYSLRVYLVCRDVSTSMVDFMVDERTSRSENWHSDTMIRW